MLNGIWLGLVVFSVLMAAWSGRMGELTEAVLADARRSVEIALGLVGVMSLFLGLFKVVEVAGLPRYVGRAAAPLLRRLFPAVPAEHPAMSAMVLNITSNLLGLSNAATPFGIRAMEELDRLNGRRGTATNAMVLFLAINTAGFAILPSTILAVRASLGSADPTGILLPVWIASGFGTLVAVTAAFALARLPVYRRSEPPALEAVPPAVEAPSEVEPAVVGRRGQVVLLFWVAFVALAVRRVLTARHALPPEVLAREILSLWMLPAMLAGAALFGWSRGIRVYDTLVEGAREGFQVAIRIIPFLVAIVVMAGMFRASGGMGLLVTLLGPLTELLGMPAEVVPVALLRPLSGSGALGVMTETMEVHGPDSFVGYLVSTLQGSTETTFYVLAVYYGAIRIRHTRHTLPACLAADVAGILAAVASVNLLYGSGLPGAR